MGNVVSLLLGGMAGGGGKGSGGGWSGGSGKTTFKVDTSGGELGEFVGTIKSFSPTKFWGFIECPDLKQYGDVFLHGDMKKGYKQGQKVKFTAFLNKDGKAQAKDLKSGLK